MIVLAMLLGGGVSPFIDPPSLAIVGGGTFFAFMLVTSHSAALHTRSLFLCRTPRQLYIDSIHQCSHAPPNCEASTSPVHCHVRVLGHFTQISFAVSLRQGAAWRAGLQVLGRSFALTKTLSGIPWQRFATSPSTPAFTPALVAPWTVSTTIPQSLMTAVT